VSDKFDRSDHKYGDKTMRLAFDIVFYFLENSVAVVAMVKVKLELVMIGDQLWDITKNIN